MFHYIFSPPIGEQACQWRADWRALAGALQLAGSNWRSPIGSPIGGHSGHTDLTWGVIIIFVLLFYSVSM